MAESEGLSAGFGSAQLQRLLLPGLVAAAGLHAYLPRFATRLGAPLELNGNAIFVVEVILYGFLISTAATPIIYIYEGFRAPWLTRPAKACNSAKLKRFLAELVELYTEKKEESERAERITSYLADFPYRKRDDGALIFEVERPTRLGNLIAAYELYPKRVYDIDGIFFWRHLNYLAPEAARKDVDGKSTWAESILLSSAAGAGVALVALVFLLARLVGHCAPAIAFLPSPLSVPAAWWTFAFGAASFGVFYRLSWPAYRDYRDSFRSMVDLAMPSFKEWIEKAPVAPPADLQRRATEVKNYLRELESSSATRIGAAPRRDDPGPPLD